MSVSLTVVILTRNEAIHLARAISSVVALANRVVVIDSFSTDNTVRIAESMGADVFLHEFVNYAKQFQWGLDNTNITSDWVMRLDADEIVENDLMVELTELLPALPPNVAGVNLRRKHIVFDRWIKHGGRFPLILLRIWRNGLARIEDRWMDEHMVLEAGSTVTAKGGFADHNLNDLSFFTEKHNKYATREAIDVLNRELNLFPPQKDFKGSGNSRQATVKRWIKERIYNATPFGLAALGYFMFRYVLQLGFLDGKAGLVYHVLQGFWYRFLVGAKVYELRRAVEGIDNRDEVIAELGRRTGLKLM